MEWFLYDSDLRHERVNVKSYKHFSTFHLHHTVSIHEKLYGLGNPSLSFINHLANYQLTIKEQVTNGISQFIISEKQLIMVKVVLQVWF